MPAPHHSCPLPQLSTGGFNANGALPLTPFRHSAVRGGLQPPESRGLYRLQLRLAPPCAMLAFKLVSLDMSSPFALFSPKRSSCFNYPRGGSRNVSDEKNTSRQPASLLFIFRLSLCISCFAF